MSLTALSLVLVAAIVHAGWNFTAKRVRRGGARFVWAYYTVSTVVVLPVLVVALLTGNSRPHWSWLMASSVTAVLHIASGVILQLGYDKGDLSVVYPVARGTGPFLAVGLAVVLLGERPGVVGVLGAVLIVAGVLTIGSRGLRASGPVAGTGIGYGVATGAVIAANTLWDAYSVTVLEVPPLIYFGAGAALQSLLLLPHALRGPDEMRLVWQENRAQVLIVGLLAPIASLLVLHALRLAPVSLVAPAREVGIVLGGLAGWLLLGEKGGVRRLVGSVVVLAGIAAIALA